VWGIIGLLKIDGFVKSNNFQFSVMLAEAGHAMKL
jgi:hypothetical protein